MDTQETPSMKRRAREKREHTKSILQAAEKIFAKNGYANTTMAEIAREAQFSVGSLYNFFENKDQLGEAVLQHVMDERVQDIQNELKKEYANAEEALRGILHSFVQYHVRHDSFMRIQFEHMHRNSSAEKRSEPHPAIKNSIDNYEKCITEFFQREQDKGYYRSLSLSAEDLSNVFGGICMRYLLKSHRNPGGMQAAELELEIWRVLQAILPA